eukprot:13303305-Alexandrium_andersonii.AAC.1
MQHAACSPSADEQLQRVCFGAVPTLLAAWARGHRSLAAVGQVARGLDGPGRGGRCCCCCTCRAARRGQTRLA